MTRGYYTHPQKTYNEIPQNFKSGVSLLYPSTTRGFFQRFEPRGGGHFDPESFNPIKSLYKKIQQ